MTKDDLKQLQKEAPFAPISTLIYEYIKDEIIKIHLLPETRLIESQIATDLGISRTPVNTALDMLVEEGLLSKEEHKAPVVATASLRDCLYIYHARMGIEGEAAYYAAQNASDEQIAEIEALQKEYRQYFLDGRDPMDAAEIDYKLHGAVVNASGNPYIIGMYDCIKARALRSRCYVQYLVGPKDSSKELTQRLRCHDSFIFALKNGMADAARDAIKLDINGMIEMYVLR